MGGITVSFGERENVLEDPFGKGTLDLDDLDASELKLMRPDQYEVFDAILNKCNHTGCWKKREDKKIVAVRENHYLLMQKEVVLGGFSAFKRGENWYEITTLWTQEQWKGMGIGKIIMDKMKGRFTPFYLFCKQENSAQSFFEKMNLKNMGSDIQNLDVPDFIKNTPHSEGASVFLWENKD